MLKIFTIEIDLNEKDENISRRTPVICDKFIENLIKEAIQKELDAERISRFRSVYVDDPDKRSKTIRSRMISTETIFERNAY